MKLTTDKPTEPGWYWVFGVLPYLEKTVLACTYVTLEVIELLPEPDLISYFDWPCDGWGVDELEPKDITHWAGPIVEVRKLPYQIKREPVKPQRRLTPEEAHKIRQETISKQIEEGAIIGGWQSVESADEDTE